MNFSPETFAFITKDYIQFDGQFRQSGNLFIRMYYHDPNQPRNPPSLFYGKVEDSLCYAIGDKDCIYILPRLQLIRLTYADRYPQATLNGWKGLLIPFHDAEEMALLVLKEPSDEQQSMIKALEYKTMMHDLGTEAIHWQ